MGDMILLAYLAGMTAAAVSRPVGSKRVVATPLTGTLSMIASLNRNIEVYFVSWQRLLSAPRVVQHYYVRRVSRLQ